MAGKLNLTPEQRTVIEAANHLYEDNEQDEVSVTDIYCSTDLEFEQIHEAIETAPVMNGGQFGTYQILQIDHLGTRSHMSMACRLISKEREFEIWQK